MVQMHKVWLQSKGGVNATIEFCVNRLGVGMSELSGAHPA